jgi:predicted branched-subunit amino acid permease
MFDFALRPKNSFVQGLLDGFPGGAMLLLSFALVGAAASSAGLSSAQSLAMTLTTFAAPAQLAAIEMIHGGAGAFQIVTAVALVNLRFLFMAASLKHQLNDTPRSLKLIGASMLTATTFAITSMKLSSEQPPKRNGEYFVGIGLAALSLAIVGTWFGSRLTAYVPSYVVTAVPVVTAVFLAARLATPRLTEKHGLAFLGFLATPMVKPFFGPYAFIVVAIAIAIVAAGLVLRKEASDVI